MSVGVCISEEERTWWRSECFSFVDGEEREKRSKLEIIKILNIRAIATVQICIVVIALVHLYTNFHLLMWVFFAQKV